MIERNFKDWWADDVERTFQIARKKAHEIDEMQTWLQAPAPTGELHSNFTRLRELLEESVDAWNEDELKLMFIGPLLLEVNFNDYPNYKVFSQRFVKFRTEEVQAQGRIEWMVAQGRQYPLHPFFFLHEYKPEKSTGNDPLGQLLIAMVYAQNENKKDKHPLYGSYVLGRLWFFAILKAQEYTVSRAFDATQDDDFREILAKLQYVKHAVRRQLNLDESS